MSTNDTPTLQPPFLPELDEESLAALEEIDFNDLFDYEEQPLLLVDTEPERAVVRQQELMATCFEPIGQEAKEEKRMGLAMQQLDIEQRHALRLLLIYEDPAELTAHFTRCLAEPTYGYGERGGQGRTIAQAMAAVAEDDLAQIAPAWLASHREFQQSVLSGTPLNFRSLFDQADIDNFVPLIQRVEENRWRLGVEGEGQVRDFQGSMAEIWPQLCDTYVQWSEADNESWLTGLKRQAARLPDSIQRTARAERLRKVRNRLELDAEQGLVTLTTDRSGPDWPRLVTMADGEGLEQLGLSRLSGHGLYELAWEGGLRLRRFELSGTSRASIPFEHIEVALRLAESLGAESGLVAEPVTPDEVEAAYLRRMKATEARVGPPTESALPPAVVGQAVGSYRVGEIGATLLHGGEDLVYVSASGGEPAVLLRRDERRGLVAALPVRRGRPSRGQPLMTTPLAELEPDPSAWARALCAWGIWLVWVLSQK